MSDTVSSLTQTKSLLTDPALASAVTELFVERLVSNFSPKDHAKYGGTIALREASELRMLSPIICNAFEAASLTFAGRRDRNQSVEVAGHSRYVRVLRQLQNALYDPKQSNSTEVLVAILLATIVEVRWSPIPDLFFYSFLGRPLNKAPEIPYSSTNLEASSFSACELHTGIALELNGRYSSTFDSIG